MGNNYSNVLNRLIECRKEKHLKQMDVKDILGITQGEYSYIENGKTKLSGEILEKLYSKGWDVNYILSGRCTKNQKSSLRDSLLEFSKYKQSVVLRYIGVVLMTIIEEDDLEINCKNELLLLHLLLDFNEDETVLFAARNMLNEPQATIAYLFGMSVKAYRDYEKGRKKLDAESLEIISRLTKCRPTLFMALGSERWDIVEYVWDSLDLKMKKIAVEIINNTILLLNKIRDE